MNARLPFSAGLALALALSGACASDLSVADEEVAEAHLEVTTVPPAVRCLVLKATSTSRSRQWAEPLGGMGVFSLDLDDVPVGSVTFRASAFDAPCVGDGADPALAPSWLSDPLRVQMVAGGKNTISLVLRPNSSSVDGSVGFETPVVQIALGEQSSYALLADGRVMAWGQNDHAQMGNGNVASQLRPALVQGMPGPARFVAAGSTHACVILRDDDSVWCWGASADGRLGDRVGHDQAYPSHVDLPAPGRARALALGSSHTCALLSNGALSCWGSNAEGELGQGPLVDQPGPLPGIIVGSAGGFPTLSAGTGVTCVTLNVGAVRCSVKTTMGPTPVGGLDLVNGLTGGIVQLEAGSNGVRMGLRADGQLFTWISQSTATLVPGISDVEQFATTGLHTCAVFSDGELSCWGAGGSGQLGNGSPESTTAPRTVPGLTNVVQVATGTAHTCAVVADGSAYCWGRNINGALGTGDQYSRYLPTRVTF